jgi:hypothetical protein
MNTIELEIQQFWAGILIDDAMLRNSKVQVSYRLENLAYQVRVLHKTAAQTLQNDKEVAKWPATRWDNFLVAVGLKKYAKYARLKFTEMLTFPSIELPPYLQDKTRIYTHQSIGVY